ncbi:hypothetical protein [Pseudorhodobacter turbinis]|uniref:hypothetical protein n=1 Tax=Pseudorhodobacter turbinis TaxID=2500533 RepID=UPI001980860D|nr:hypothetical protein [Pseudorhodobacter turbinis]
MQHVIAGETDGMDMAMDEDSVLARLTPSLPRRVAGVVTQGAFGALLIGVAMDISRDQMVLRIAVLAAGVLLIYGAYRMWAATRIGLILTQTALRDSNGRLLAEVANIREVSRGAFAFKPTHGFSLILTKGMGGAWAPGLWWRVGSRLGVGGVTPAQPGRYMAEAITDLVARRGL